MTTFDPSRLSDCVQLEFPWMSSAEAFPARTSALQAEVPASTASAADCGPSSPGSLTSYDPTTRSWRTSQRSFLEGWETFSGTWPRSGMMRSGTAFPLRPLARLTAATGSGLWATPVAQPANGTPERFLERKRESVARGAKMGICLTDLAMQVQAAQRGMWPTPHGFSPDGRSNGPSGNELGHAVNRSLWPTPSARDWKGAPASLDTMPANARPLNEVVRFATPGGSRPHDTDQLSGRLSNQIGGSLNPTWVEWLMGLPLGWTDCAR